MYGSMDFTQAPSTYQRVVRLRPRFRALRALARFLHKREIRVDGEPYLERFYLLGPMDAHTASYWPEDDRPAPGWLRQQLTRRTWYLHRFHAPDADRDLHNHPWEGTGRILAGAYEEVYTEPVQLRSGLLAVGYSVEIRKEGDPTHVTPDRYHKIRRLVRMSAKDPREVWTLLRVAPRSGGWGYLVGTQHVDHREYQSDV